MCGGQPDSDKARLIIICRASSGVEIIPPQRVTRARANVLLQRTTSSRSIWSAIARIAGFETRIARISSLNSWNSRFSSFINRFWSLISFFISTIFCCCEWITARSSRTQLWSYEARKYWNELMIVATQTRISPATLNSSLGIIDPQPRSQGSGFFGLCSHSSRWLFSVSSLRICVQP